MSEPKRKKLTTNAKILAFALLVGGGLVVIQITPSPMPSSSVAAGDVADAQEAQREADDRALHLDEAAAADVQAARHDKRDAGQLAAEAKADVAEADQAIQSGDDQAKADDAQAIRVDGAGIRN